MKKIFPLLPVLFILILSCTDRKPDKKLFNPGNLRTQRFTIDPTMTNTLTGHRGGIFSIEQGSFEGDGPVDIEIKEAYSPTEILYAGLTTESDGRLLESGGMVYFNARRNGKQLKLIKLVGISVPTHYISKEMKIFKGEEQSDGSINWVDPEPLDSSINQPPIDTGRILFEANCASCHNPFKENAYPSLAFVEEKITDRELLRAFIRNPGRVMAENIYFQCQKAKYGSIMTAFPTLTDREIDLILEYIKNESAGRPDLRKSFDAKPAHERTMDTTGIGYSCIAAPCGFDTLYVDTTAYEFGPGGNFMDLHAEATKADSLDNLYKKPDSLEKAMRTNGFTDIITTESRYNFKVETLGWFNVDAFYEGLKGTQIVDLFVDTDFGEEQEMEVYVFFPSKKILTVGKYHGEDNLFHFEKYKGQIPLYINDEAIAFGFAAIGEKLYYGISSFTVKKMQTIKMDIKETTAESLTRAFKEMKLDGINLDMITRKRVIIPRNCNDSVTLAK